MGEISGESLDFIKGPIFTACILFSRFYQLLAGFTYVKTTHHTASRKNRLFYSRFYSLPYTKMRKITRETCKAFYDGQTCKMSNVVVDYGINHHFYYFLHNNLIGDYNPKKSELTIEDAGRQTNTTKERLNGILDVFGLGYIYQKNFQWYYVNQNGNEEKRNGRKTFQNV